MRVKAFVKRIKQSVEISFIDNNCCLNTNKTEKNLVTGGVLCGTVLGPII